MKVSLRLFAVLSTVFMTAYAHGQDVVEAKGTKESAEPNGQIKPTEAAVSLQKNTQATTQTTQDTVAKKSNEGEQNKTPLAKSPRGVLQLDETVISGNQELPKVLYILPWREPQGLPQIEIQAEFTEAEVFRRLYPPAYRRELSYFETLRGLKDDVGPNQEE